MIDGHHQNKLPCKPDHTKLNSNQGISKARLESTTRKLKKMGRLEEYDRIIQEQLNSGTLQFVPKGATSRKYSLHTSSSCDKR